MIYLFQYEASPRRWESIGTGEGSGDEALREAFQDLAQIAGHQLRPGRYRYLAAAAGIGSRWGEMELDEAGELRC